MTEKELARGAAYRLAIIRHAEEVYGNVARPAATTASAPPTYYKWLDATRSTAIDGLRDAPAAAHQPQRHPCRGRGQDRLPAENYHFGPHKISMYLQRYHDINMSPSGVWSILKRLDISRLPSSQRYKRTRSAGSATRNRSPATESRWTSSSSIPFLAHARSTTSTRPSTTAPGSGSFGSMPRTIRKSAIQFVDYVFEKFPF